MESNVAKILDEACNGYNEVYRDEYLYTPVVGAAISSACPPSAQAGLSARLFTRQEIKR